MKNIFVHIGFTALATALASVSFAGNKDRSGQAGASELLINPWAATAGVFGANTANVKGMEAMRGNIAGLAYATGTEIGATYNVYLKGTDVSVYNLSFAQNFGNSGSSNVLGINIQAMNFGEVPITTTNNPTGGIGSYKPSFFNIQAGFAKEFSRAIHAGVGATFVSEQITNARASGAAFEAGVQYTTGRDDNFHFGVTLRNVGTNMRYSGEGFSFDSETPGNLGYVVGRRTPTEKFEMPTYLNIGAAYDFYLGAGYGRNNADTEGRLKHRLTAMLAFQSNSFNNDYIGVGAEYAYREMFMIRAGYRYEKGIGDLENTTTFYKGFSAGATVGTMYAKRGPRIAFDYAFRPTSRPDNGVHNFSLRFMFGGNKSAAAQPEIEQSEMIPTNL
jgi:hypothetical protein